MSELRGRRVLITGGSSGLGAALGSELASRGASVGLTARREERLEEVVSSIVAAGGTAAWAAAEVRDREGLQAALDRLAHELGGADVVVANAGFNRFEPPSRFVPGKAATIYDVNLMGTLHVVDWALPRFLAAGRGHLVGVSSAASYFGIPGSAAYSGSKAAMRLHLQSLRVALRPRGIEVTTICPGFVETELTAKNDFPMPWLWPVDRAARVMADAIAERRGEVVFPWQMALLVAVATRLPRRVLERILSRRNML